MMKHSRPTRHIRRVRTKRGVKTVVVNPNITKQKRILLYKDNAGNTINKQYIKSRDVWQLVGYNAEGQLLSGEAFNELARKGGIGIRSGATKPGIERVRRRNVKRKMVHFEDKHRAIPYAPIPYWGEES